MNLLSIEIDKNSPIPIHFQLTQGVIRLIESGSLRPGDILPSENELSQAYNVSPMTVRQAMLKLVSEGYIYRRRGRGTFVSQTRLRHQLENLVGFSEDMQNRGMKPASHLLIFEQMPPPDFVLERAGLPPGSCFTRIKRVRYADDRPVGIHDSYVNTLEITQEELVQTGSLYGVLGQHNIIIEVGEETIEAVAAQEEAATLLHVPLASPLLLTTRFSWDRDGRFVEYVVAFYHPDLYRYTIGLKRLR